MLKSKKYLFKILVVIAIIISTIFVFTGCGKKDKSANADKQYLQPLTDYFEGIKNKDLSRLLKAFPDFMKMSEKVTDTDIEDLYNQYESMYGANIKIEYSLGDAVALGEDEIKQIEEDLKAIYTDQENLDITAAYSVPVTVTITGDGITSNSDNNTIAGDNSNNNTEEEDMYVIQYNGSWYIM